MQKVTSQKSSPGSRVEGLAHMRIVLSQDSDGITLLSNNQSCLLLSGISQIYPIKLLEYHTKQSSGSKQKFNAG